ncbi:MAG: phosphatase PAP2 family protein [Planctomycetes bacterium]|nr:phosphatase PAP2 family protein [Planctomycetota bacterium]MCB9904511.1 phosphatase PAP2 family protein [Planctomycetota bacterium]
MSAGRLRTIGLGSLLLVGCAATPAYRPTPLNGTPASSAVSPSATPRLRPRSATAPTAPASTNVAAADDGRAFGPGVMGRPDHEGFDAVGTVATAITVAMLVPLTFADDLETRENTGDVLQILLPTLALTGTLVEGDREGSVQFTKSFLTSWATTYALKYSVEKWRPSGANTQSFPSGHTMGAFAGASFIQQRYGNRFGIPAYLAAVFTGVSRVDSQNHFMDDVVAGASISMLSTWYWVTPISDTTRIDPVMTEEGGVGIGISVSNETAHTIRDHHHQDPDDFEKRFRFEWSFGAAYQSENVVQSPRGTGDPIDLSEFKDTAETMTTSQLVFEYYPAPRHEFDFRFSPFEVRDTGTLAQPASFAGSTFPANQTLGSSYQYYDSRFWYRYDLLEHSRWTAKLGLALAIVDLNVAITDGTQTAEVGETVVLPALHGHLGYWFTPRLRLFTETDVSSFEGDDLVDGTLMLRYDMSRQWDIGLGYRYVHREIDVDQLTNRLDQSRGLLSIGHSF